MEFDVKCRFLDPIVFGDYPGEMREKLGSRLPKFSPEESGKLAGSFDFMGINHYITVYATSNPHLSPHLLPQRYPDSMVYLTGERNGIPIGEQVRVPYLLYKGRVLRYLCFTNLFTFTDSNGGIICGASGYSEFCPVSDRNLQQAFNYHHRER